ncbi:MAG: histidine kinase [Actinomycetota bacterium]
MPGPEPLSIDRADAVPLRQFATLDLAGAVFGLVFVVVANGLIFRVAGVWSIVPFLAILIGALVLARRWLDEGRIIAALWAIAIGNWQIAIAVAVVLPFVWPVMVLAVVMPVVLAAPYLETDALIPWLALTAIVGGLTSIIGLGNDDGGAVPDIEDETELFVVAGGLAAFLVPIALIVWQQSQRQRSSQLALAASQRRVVEASDAERSRIERDLHDGAQQRLVALGLQLQLLAARVEGDDELAGSVDRLHGDLTDAIGELRELAHGIYPPVLEANGLRAALLDVARRSPSDVRVDAAGDERFGRAVETTLYFVALEALSNAAKHAPGSAVRLRIDTDGESVRLDVSDDGPGLTAGVSTGRGLLNMEDRMRAIGGTLDVSAVESGGTVVHAEVVLVPPPGGAGTTAN